ncbi:MAG: bifunctional phosphoglucose/phosphomannose isomerase [Candidatus Heimdallarchaeota archaeon]|nr:bifunctional phosphoglucose/phosphomannose isomerase [Candidatus Heimdallarchaeota archaeon]MCK4877612.1 bifunctional phosphoglucose/phosphomannose isomerase [Candidatus Heimdallarchaeota archaeon]
MIDLDEKNLIAKYDKSNQLGIMEDWAKFVHEAREKSLKFEIPQSFQWKDRLFKFKEPTNVIICGMGGSAIAGDYVARLFEKELRIPLIVSRDYYLPSFVDENSLVICISYSGNTEETLSRYLDALQKGSMIIAISSSGALEEFSKATRVPHLKIKEGIPPRSSLPLIYITLITLLEKLNIVPSIAEDIIETEKLLRKLALEYAPVISTDDNVPKKIAYGLFNTLPIFLGNTIYSPVAYRAKCEFNENSKIIALSEEIPEHNHNGIVVFDNPDRALNDVAFVFFREKEESKPLKIRIEEVKKLATERTEKVLEIYSQGKSILAKQLSSTYLIDFVSIYLAILYEVDPTITPSIDKLKEVLKKNLNTLEDVKKQILK